MEICVVVGGVVVVALAAILLKRRIKVQIKKSGVSVEIDTLPLR